MSLPIITPPVSENIPELLKNKDQWVNWRYEKRDERLTKVPIIVGQRRRASVIDSSTWAPFLDAIEHAGSDQGIGFVLREGDGIVGVDLDHCISETGETAAWAAAIVADLNSYTEISPSGRGLRIFCLGLLPPGRRRKESVEMYDKDRYLTVTGKILNTADIDILHRHDALIKLYFELFPVESKTAAKATEVKPNLLSTDTELIDQMFSSASGAKIKALWHGSTEGFPSHSEAVSALIFHLVWWSYHDASVVDRLFRQSQLCADNPEKWDRLGAAEIDSAMQRVERRRAPAPKAAPSSPELPATMQPSQPRLSAAEILSSSRHKGPADLDEMLRRHTPQIWDFVEDATVDELLYYAQSESHGHRAAIQQYLVSIKLPVPTRRLIQDRMVSRAQVMDGHIHTRMVNMSSFDHTPPVPPIFQHEALLTRSGVTVLAGRPKVGKSYLALNLSLAVASDGLFLGHFKMSHPGGVLYLALEDNESRMYYRTRALLAGEPTPESLWLDRFAPRINGHFCDDVSLACQVIRDAPVTPRLVVIDIFGMVKSQNTHASANIYDTEYEDMSRLRDLAESQDIHILLVTHLNKNYKNVADSMDAVMSSTAIVGGASGIWILTHEGSDGVDGSLSVSGKDIPSSEFALKRLSLDGHMDWQHLGHRHDVLTAGPRAELLVALWRWQGEAPTQTELLHHVFADKNKGNFSRVVAKCCKDGFVTTENNRLTLTKTGVEAVKTYLDKPEV